MIITIWYHVTNGSKVGVAIRAVQYFINFLLFFLAGVAYFNVRVMCIRGRATFRGEVRCSEKYIRSDNNFYAVLRDSLPEVNSDDHEAFTSESDGGLTVVRGKRQRISTVAKAMN